MVLQRSRSYSGPTTASEPRGLNVGFSIRRLTWRSSTLSIPDCCLLRSINDAMVRVLKSPLRRQGGPYFIPVRAPCSAGAILRLLVENVTIVARTLASAPKSSASRDFVVARRGTTPSPRRRPSSGTRTTGPARRAARSGRWPPRPRRLLPTWRHLRSPAATSPCLGARSPASGERPAPPSILDRRSRRLAKPLLPSTLGSSLQRRPERRLRVGSRLDRPPPTAPDRRGGGSHARLRRDATCAGQRF